MRNIVFTLTPNPALDLNGVVDNIKPNEKSYVHDEVWSPGGNGINVAKILTRLDIPVLASGFLGGSVGEEIKALLKKEGVVNKFIKTVGHSRISLTVSNRRDHRQMRLCFAGPHISGREKSQLFDLLEKEQRISILVIGGSLPRGFAPADIIRILRLAKKRKIDSVVDCPGAIMRELVLENPFFIKPNLDEFRELTQSKVETLSAVHKEAQKLLGRVPYICVSSVEGGALLVTREGTYFGRTPKVKVRSSVGAGDSMVGAMVAQLFKKNSSGEDLLRWGLAASAATLTQSGTAMGSASDILNLYEVTKVRRFY